MQPPSENSRPIKILMMGHLNSVSLHPLVVQLKKQRDLQISALEMLIPGAEVRGVANVAYDQVLQIPDLPRGPGRPALVKELWNGLSRQEKRQFLDTCRRKPAPGHIRKTIQITYLDHWQAQAWKRLLPGFDLYHLHYLNVGLTDPVQHIPASAPILLTIWGSDLLDTAGMEAYAQHLAICERANLITCVSQQIAEYLLVKFGRHLQPKIRLAGFGSTMLDVINQVRPTSDRAAFLKKLGLPPNRITICIGHSSAPVNQHLRVLESIARLPESWHRQLSLIIPLTYGLDQEYLAKLKSATDAIAIPTVLLTEFMKQEDVARLRLFTDVLVNVCSTDQFSSAMLETLHAGGVVLNGSWLPYNKLREHRVYYREVFNLASLSEDLREVLENLEREKQHANGNREKIYARTNVQYEATAWINIYDELLSRSEETKS